MQSSNSDDDVFLTRRGAARLTTLSYSWLAHAGAAGPPLIRVSGRVAYSRAALLQWMDAHRVARRRGRPRKEDNA
jgi:hypothetical protein